MNEPTMEALARRLRRGGKGLFAFLLIGLFACEQTIDRSIKDAGTSCWKKQGVCVTKKWKATGLIHGTEKELAEIIVGLEWENTCNPSPAWFRAKDWEWERRIAHRKKEEKETRKEKPGARGPAEPEERWERTKKFF